MPARKPKRQRRIRQQKTGTVFFNAARDRWQGSLELPAKESGKRSRKTYTARQPGNTTAAREEVERQLETWKGQYAAGSLKAPSRETVHAYLEDWCATQSALRWGVQRAESVKGQLELYVLPVIGTMRLADVDAAAIMRVLATMARRTSRMTKKPMAKSSLDAVYRILHAAFGRRVDWDAVTAPVVKRQPPDLPDPADVSAVLAAGLPTRYGLLFALMATCGLGTGEVLGLRRADLDFDRCTVTVSGNSIIRGAHRGERKEAKAETRHRTIGVDAEIMAALREYCETRAALQLKVGRVFVTDDGKVPGGSSLCKEWRRLLTAQGLPYFRPYALRHFAASWWLDSGISVPEVSAALGHASQTTTLRVYAHMLRRSESRITQAGGRLLRMGKDEKEEEA